MVKVIATGITGLVGSRIAQLNPDIQFIDISIESGISILDPVALEKVFTDNSDAVAVLHLAAFTDTNGAWLQNKDQSGLCYQLNVVGTQNMVNLCQKYDKYLIHISTDFVFDGTKEGKYLETDTPNPIEWYGETKYLAEKVVVDSGIKASVLRLAFPYRANFEPKKDIIRKLIDGFKAGKLYPQWTDHFTSKTFIDDLGPALRYFIDHQPLGIFHCCGSSAESPFDMCQLVAEVFGFDKNLVVASTLVDFLKTQAPGSRPWQKNLALDNTKITALGINMRTLHEGLEEMKKQLS